MTDQIKNIMIGIFVLAAFAIMIFIMLFLHPNIGNEGQRLTVRFADIDKISNGTRVTFGGRPVGEVVEIKTIDAGESRFEYGGFIYIYQLTLAIDSSVDVYTTDEIASRTSGLLGEKSISIMPMPVKKGEKLIRATESSILYATEAGSIDSAIKEVDKLSEKLSETLDNFNKGFIKLQEQDFWNNLGEMVKNIKDIAKEVNQPEKLSEMVDNTLEFSRNAREISMAFNQPEKISEIIDNTLDVSEKARKSFADFEQISKNIDSIVAGVQRGRGSLGKMIVREDLYLQVSSVLSKAETIFNDINHYGLLFHNDNGWKRLRARRLNLLQDLSSPQEFRNYFNDEIDMISTSLSRVNQVMELTEEKFPCLALWQNPEYVKVYGELLRRVAELEEFLQMYNQQVVDTKVLQTELKTCY